MSYLHYLCMFAYSVVFFVLFVFVLCLVYPMLPVSLEGTVKHEQSRDTDNSGHKTMFYKRSFRENQRDCQA
jgi:lipopolysaccharide/colanic/teichoic acid biosynthesis glycosyltransferase